MKIVAKTATYSIMHVIVTFCIGYLVSGEVHIALGISLLEPFAQIVCFAVHEHIWERVRPGSSRHTPSTCCADAELISEVVETLKPQKR